MYTFNLEVNKFILSLKNSSIFLNHQIYSRSQKQVEFFNSIGLNILFSKKECEFCLRIQHLCIFDNMMIENLTLKLDNSLNFECMVPNIINSSILFDFNEDKSLVEDNLKKIPIIIYKTKLINISFSFPVEKLKTIDDYKIADLFAMKTANSMVINNLWK